MGGTGCSIYKNRCIRGYAGSFSQLSPSEGVATIMIRGSLLFALVATTANVAWPNIHGEWASMTNMWSILKLLLLDWNIVTKSF